MRIKLCEYNSQFNKTPERRKILSDLKKGNYYWLGKKHSAEAKEKMIGALNGRARKVYCNELNMSFDCGKYAAKYFGVTCSAITNAIKRGNRIKRKYKLNYE